MSKQDRPDPESGPDPLADPRLRRRLWLARAALVWERLWPRLWRPAAVAGVFLAVALLDLLPRLPGGLHALILAGFAGAFLLAARRGPRPRWPDEAEGRRRLERDSGLRHRPLSGLDDSLALGGDDPAATALWDAHRSRLRAALSRLRVGLPRAGLAPADPLALRAIPVLLLAVGLSVAGAQAPTRLGRALLPDFTGAEAPPPSVSVWIDPPGYTGEPPRVLAPGPDAPADAVAATPSSGDAGTAVPVPEGSRVLARVDGLDGAPVLALGGRTLRFERVAGDVWQVEGAVRQPIDSPLAVRHRDRTLVSWPLTVVFDQPPTVAFAEPPAAGRRHALTVAYEARDDYGLAGLRLEITRAGKASGKASDAAIRRDISVASGEGAEGGLSGVSYHDLTAHPWAGLKVHARLIAEDGAGQTGRSRSVAVTLPERPFTHPVAKALVRLRKDLSRDPTARGPVVTGLKALQQHPEAFQGQVAVALALRLSERRLVYDESRAAVTSAQRLMWQTALALEDGELSIAERELRRAQEALEEALARDDASEAELDRLMARLETAMAQFLDALRAQQAERLSESGMAPSELPPDARVLEGRELQEMLRRLREMTETGARKAAQEMLGELRSLLENLDLDANFARLSDEAQQAQELLDRLDGLSRAQQRLLDESFRNSQEGGGDRGQPRAGDEAAARQEGLRRELGQLLRDLGGALGRIPGPLGEAEQAMRRATRALEQGQPGAAVPPQGEAVEKLRQGRRAMQQAFQRRLRPGPGRAGQGRVGGEGSAGRDPLGRPTRETGRGGQDTGDVKIPNESEIQRAREILDTLRRRAGERDRPELEQDYIRRLLDRF